METMGGKPTDQWNHQGEIAGSNCFSLELMARPCSLLIIFQIHKMRQREINLFNTLQLMTVEKHILF
jgi:hypothetical protein